MSGARGHRVEIEAALRDHLPELTGEGWDNLLTVLYCWRDEAVTEAVRRQRP